MVDLLIFQLLGGVACCLCAECNVYRKYDHHDSVAFISACGIAGEEKEMKKKWIMITSIIALILIGGALMGPIMSDVEKPDYKVLTSSENIQIRQYPPMIIAEVEVEGNREAAIGDGFRLLADYIFGNNTVQKDIAMTAPVQQQESQKIAMTAPVQQQSTGTTWKVSFVMPAGYSMESLPKPNNDRVTLQEIAASKLIVIRFSGTSSDKNVAGYEKQLMDYIAANQIKTTCSARYAFYNPPWTLPFMRRNEVMLEINEQQ
jgi:effector-binding domain-containing protein